MGDYEYKAGLSRGLSGKSTSAGTFQGHFDKKDERSSRSAGFRDGLKIRASKKKK